MPSTSLRPLLAALVLALADGASARVVPPAPDPASPPITSRTWRGHPAVAAIRALVKGDQLALLSKRWPADPARRCLATERPLGAEAIAYRDEERRIRVLVKSAASDAAIYRLEHHYDDLGRLRFAFGRSEAANGSSVEYRIYLDEWGRELWREVRARGRSDAFLRPPAFPDAALVRDPVKAVAVPLRCEG